MEEKKKLIDDGCTDVYISCEIISKCNFPNQAILY